MNKQKNALTLVRAAAVLLVAPVALFLSGCNRGDQQHGMPPAPVTVMTIEPKSIPAVFEYPGQTAGSREVEVRARVTGILLKRNYREGSTVAEGQSLFIIDPAPYQAALARAEADVSAAQARHGQAQRNAVRMKPLFEARAVSQKENDDAVSAESIAEADVKAAQARWTDAKLNLNYTRVESPIGGIASRSLRSEGNFVTGPDVLLTTVSQINPIHVLFGVSDEQRLRMNREVQEKRLVLPVNGQFEVTLKLNETTTYPRIGKLDFADVRISTTTGTSETRAEVPNPNGMLHPGQFVRVVLKGAQRPNAILVPQRAVLEGPKGKFVYVVVEGKADAHPVVVGDWQDDQWIIISGINAGDKVIVDGVMKIGPGAPVQVVDPNAPPPVGAPPSAAPAAPKAETPAPPAAKPDAPASAPATPAAPKSAPAKKAAPKKAPTQKPTENKAPEQKTVPEGKGPDVPSNEPAPQAPEPPKNEAPPAAPEAPKTDAAPNQATDTQPSEPAKPAPDNKG